jgi:RNA polymerase sigma factor (sigma-70 family)
MNAPSANQSTANHEIWQAAMGWVRSHMHIVHWVARPYLPYMAADEDDLFQEATMAAVHALIVVQQKNSPQRLTPFFRVIFKTHCLKMAAGVQPVHSAHDYLLCTASREEEEYLPEPYPCEIEEALQVIDGRKREICSWILQQELPVTTLEAAHQFKVSRRQVCRLLNHTLLQLTEAA